MHIDIALLLHAALALSSPNAPVPPQVVAAAPRVDAQPRFRAIAGELDFTGELIARPRQDLTRAERKAALKLIAGETLRHHAATDEFILCSGVALEPLGAYENRRSDSLLASGLFQYVHPNWMLYPVTVPNDPRVGEQWHHAMMHSYDAWTISSGSPSVIVAVTDTGIVPHEDLTHRVSGYNAVSLVPEALGGDLTDIHGHGTHVAGCAAATGDNGVGVAGSGWNLSVMPIRVSEASNGGASFESLLAGSRWAIENGAKVTSASYSGIGYDAVETTGAYIHSLDGSLMWAAGNSSTNHAGWDFENVLVVGASDSNDQRAYFSSYGRGVDLFSPGVGILSSTTDGGYQAWSGTSMATPVANGALGVIRSANPALSARHAEYILLHTCDSWGDMANSVEWGFGRIHLQHAAEQAIAASSPQAPIARNDYMRSFVGADVLIDALINDYDANMDTLVFDWVASESSLGDVVEIEPLQGAGSPVQIRMLADIDAPTGLRTIAYRLREPIAGQTAEAVMTVMLEPLRVAVQPVGELPGLACNYYAIDALSALPDWSTLTPYRSEFVREINYASTNGNYANSQRADQVGAVYDGWLSVPTPGLWTVSITSDDGSRMSIGNEMVINNDGLHGMQTASAQFAFSAGMYPIRLEFFENGGGAGFTVNWSGPGIPSAAIAAPYFFYGGAVSPADINHDGRIDAADLAAVLSAWGSTSGDADINNDGVVNAVDLSFILSGWGE